MERPVTPTPENAASAAEQANKRIAQWLKKVRFRKSLFGVSEKDVWKKIGELNEMYQELLKAERVRYDVLLEQQKSAPPEEGSA